MDHKTCSDINDSLTPVSYVETEDNAGYELYITPARMIARRFLQNKLAVIGLVTLITVTIFCFIAPVFYSYSESEQFYIDKNTGEELRASDDSQKLSISVLNSLKPPCAKHILGTNKFGQDMLARIMYGGRISLIVGVSVVLIELFIGIMFGGAAGYYGGIINGVIMRFIDIISSIPDIPLMLILSSMLAVLQIPPKNKIYFTMLIIGLLWWTHVARMVRGCVLSLCKMEFMQAVDATGIKTRHKIFRHLIPNMAPNLIVQATLDLGGVILLESTLSFLGVGVGVPYASWGNMVSLVNDTEILKFHPNIWLPPGLCILAVVMAFNFIGDGLRDAADPRMKGR
ncbi:MAG: ABC transporter permease [Spirochaetaceae bacterium]|jgi:peptide/nickel transport system permease protein|nr:ABC transporter permease [Spirochaetaceae bacterium]